MENGEIANAVTTFEQNLFTYSYSKSALMLVVTSLAAPKTLISVRIRLS